MVPSIHCRDSASGWVRRRRRSRGREGLLGAERRSLPHGMSVAAAGQSLAMAKKEEFSKSPSNSSASSGSMDGGSSTVTWPKQLHAQNNTPAPMEAMELVVALTTCADTVAAYNHDAANYYHTRLGEMASSAGPTPMHHVVAYFVEVLTSCCAWCACGPAEIWSLDSIVVVLVACGPAEI
jgi:hypothetical protein